MASSTSEVSVKRQTQNIFQINIEPSSSSSESSMEEWLSLISLNPVDSHKVAMYKQGLYDPGSGEICAKYTPLTSSSILRHPYYAYPGIKDPGIRKALLEPEEKKIYPLDGKEFYLDLCEEMKVIPVRRFHRSLREETIDLRYYGVNPASVRAMSKALNYNKFVRRLDLTSNFLDEDACYHLGQMLRENVTLQELVLCGCRVQAQGLRKLVVNLATRPLDLLDLSRNQIRDEGFEYLATQFIKGAVIKRLNLSYNELTSTTAARFASAVEFNNSITHLNSRGTICAHSQASVNGLISQLSESNVLVELNISWNAMKVSTSLTKLLSIRTLRILDLSNNRITQPGVTAIAANLKTASNLHTLDLSYNPMSAHDAFLLVNTLRKKSIQLVNLFMDNVGVNKKFVEERAEVLSLSFPKNCTITHGPVLHDYELSMPDMREITMKRLHFLTMKGSKRAQLDIAGYFLLKKKTVHNLQLREFISDLKTAGILVDEGLVVALTEAFPGPKLESGRTMNLPSKTILVQAKSVTRMIKLLWPDSKPIPTLLEVVAVPDKKKGKKDDGKKKKKKLKTRSRN